LGIYATPAGNVRLGLVARRTEGNFPRYPVYLFGFRVGSQRIDYTRDDVDFTTAWSTGGNSQLNTRISTTRNRYEPATLRNFRSTTGALGWNWQPTGKLALSVQLARDTGQETLISTADVNRIYTSWQLNGVYALTGKLSLTVNTTGSRSRRDVETGAPLPDAYDRDQTFSLGMRWAYSRSVSLNCQANRASRDSSVAQYTFSASSYGCTGQLLVY
jgi:hypothetical protein